MTTSQFKRSLRLHNNATGRAALIIMTFAIIGFFTLHYSHAATPTAASEAEGGTLSGNANTVSDSSASGSSAVFFGSSSPGGGTTTDKNCLASPSSCGYPDATNTGVPAGTSLVASGSLTLDTPGEVVSGKNITGCVDITASNVTFKNSIVHPTNGCNQAISVSYDGVSGVIIDHVEISGGNAIDSDNHSMAGLTGSGYTASYMNIHGTGDGIDVADNDTIQNSYIHGLWVDSNAGGPPHVDGIQSAGGSNTTITHNNIDASSGNDSAILFGADLGSITTAVASDNILAAPSGQPALRAGHNSGSPYKAKGIQFTNNRFATSNHYSFLPDGTNSIIFTGNVDDSTNAAIPNYNSAGNGTSQYYG